jgi:capping protein alpha
MATQQEIIETVTDFLLNSPPGEILDVVKDIRTLISDESLLNTTAVATFREYNTDQMIPLPSPTGSHLVLITKYGELSPNEYLDHRGAQVVNVDHLRQEIIGKRSIKSGDVEREVEPWRAAFDAQVTEYQAEHYPTGGSAVYGQKDESGGGYVIDICICSEKLSPKNYYNGRWRSVWTCTFAPNSTSIGISGEMKVNVHYYEDGNVQMTSENRKHFNLTVSSSTPAVIAEEVVATIASQEADYQSALEDNYNAMGDTTFKALRRILPITRNKVDWDKIQNYTIGADVAQYTME